MKKRSGASLAHALSLMGIRLLTGALRLPVQVSGTS